MEGMDDLLTLKGLLVFLVAGPGAGIVTSYILSKWKQYQEWDDDFWKFVIAVVAPGPLAFLAYLAMMAMLYVEPPGDVRGWIETGYAVMAAAIAGQFAHKLRQKRNS